MRAARRAQRQVSRSNREAGRLTPQGSGVVTKVTIAKKLTVSSDKAWEAIRKIGRLDVWFPTIATCTVEGDGVGAHRYITLHRGGEITDRIVDINPTQR